MDNKSSNNRITKAPPHIVLIVADIVLSIKSTGIIW